MEKITVKCHTGKTFLHFEAIMAEVPTAIACLIAEGGEDTMMVTVGGETYVFPRTEEDEELVVKAYEGTLDYPPTFLMHDEDPPFIFEVEDEEEGITIEMVEEIREEAATREHEIFRFYR